MTTVAFLTSEVLSDLTADDRLTTTLLEARGVRIVPAVWTADVDYRAFDLVVIRSTWDWYTDAERFCALLARLSAANVRVENKTAGAWLDKRYLLELASGGVRIVPTHVTDPFHFRELAAECNYDRAVFKPSLSANANRTMTFTPEDSASLIGLARLASREGVLLLQPFVEEVERDGEWSLLFFDGEFSHAVKKRTAKGEFRVQADYGGTVTRETPPSHVITDAIRALATASSVRAVPPPADLASGDFLYARVDGIVSERFGGFCVTELEVVEPELFLRFDERAPERFADAIMRRLARE